MMGPVTSLLLNAPSKSEAGLQLQEQKWTRFAGGCCLLLKVQTVAVVLCISKLPSVSGACG